MVEEKELIQKIQEYFQQQYEGGGRWFERATEIAKICLGRKGSYKPGNPFYPYYQILVNLTCSFISKSTDWEDFFKRISAPFDAFQQGADQSDITYRKNPSIQKTVAEVLIRLLSTGLPKGKNWRLFSIHLLVHLGIKAETEAAPAQYIEEEVPEEKLVSVEKGWIFKRTVIEKQIVMKKVKKKTRGPKKVPKTPQELIQEISAFA